MLKTIAGRMGCLFGMHRRARRWAKLEGQTYVSKCSYCGVRMRQIGNKAWVVDREAS